MRFHIEYKNINDILMIVSVLSYFVSKYVYLYPNEGLYKTRHSMTLSSNTNIQMQIPQSETYLEPR